MDRSKRLDKQTLYEIFRACRLCGAGAGYKMPIIQNLVKVDGEEIELRQKIRECLQLEVNSNDKMPPLICELCVDKLDDFYEFLSTCRQTNTNTRKRLGLPLQDAPATTKVTPAPVKVTPAPVKVAPVAKKVVSKDIGTETCMLGLIDATAVNQDVCIVNKRPDVKKVKRNKVQKEEFKQETLVMTEHSSTPKSPTLKDIKQLKDNDINYIKRTKDNKRKTRQNNSFDELIMTRVQKAPKNQYGTKPGPKSRKIETKDEPPPQPTRAKEKEDPPAKPTKKEEEPPKSKVKKDREDELTKLKRIRERDVKTDLTPPPAKKTKSSDPPKPPQPTKPQKCSKPPLKPVQRATTLSKTVQPDGVQCPACNAVLKNIVGFKNHMHYVHPVTWTPDNLACNACRDWFPTIEESIAHHKRHSHYKCLRCKKKYKNGVLYHQHVENKRCVPDPDIPDVRCDACSCTFPTNNLLKEHRCTGGTGPDGRQGGNCRKCNRKFTVLKNLTKHESACTFGKKETQPSIDPDVKKILLPMEVRITKCDDLLQYGPVVSACTVPHRYGLDRKISYPYMPKLRVIKKPTFFNPMLPSQDEVQEEFNMDDLNWVDFEAIDLKTVKKLSTLCLKVIFSSKMLGELEILDGIEVARRLALRKRINSIIFKSDDASSTNSDSILDKDAVAKTFEVVNDTFKSEDKNYHSDSTVFDETSVVGDVGSGSDAKIDDFDRYCLENHDNSVNVGTDNTKIDRNTLMSSVLSNTDVDINKTCDTNNVNVEEPSEGHLELSKTLRDDVTNYSSSNLSEVSEDILENNLEVKNPTDTVIENDISLKTNAKFDNISSSNDSPSVINTENSTNDNDYITMPENHDILLKNDDELTLDSVIEAKDSLTNHDKLSINNSDLIGNKNHTENMKMDTDTNSLDVNSVSNEDTAVNSHNDNPNEYSHDDGQNTKVENMDIDETCSKNSLNLENTNKISENSDTESIGKLLCTKIDIDNDKSKDSYTKDSEIVKNTSSSSEINPNHDTLQNINENIDETETTSPQKANKSLDFSVTGILNHVTSKTIGPKNIVINIEKDNTESIENQAVDTNQDTIPENNTNNDEINDDNQSIDNLSLNISLNDDNSSVKNDKTNDTISQNSISIFTNTLKEQNDDNLSVNSLKYTENSNVNNSDRFNVNDLSEDERKLMAELDEQIGETNDKIDKLNDGRDLNLENFNDGYNFD